MWQICMSSIGPHVLHDIFLHEIVLAEFNFIIFVGEFSRMKKLKSSREKEFEEKIGRTWDPHHLGLDPKVGCLMGPTLVATRALSNFLFCRKFEFELKTKKERNLEKQERKGKKRRENLQEKSSHTLNIQGGLTQVLHAPCAAYLSYKISDLNLWQLFSPLWGSR